jgi:hypothetical protein
MKAHQLSRRRRKSFFAAGCDLLASILRMLANSATGYNSTRQEV